MVVVMMVICGSDVVSYGSVDGDCGSDDGDCGSDDGDLW